MGVLVCDCEADGFLDEATRLWTIQCGDADTDEITVYADQPGYPSLREGLERLSAADKLVFHNGVGFDFPLIEKLHPGYIRREQITDTLVIVRNLFPENRANSLDDWGKRLGEFKGEFSDFSRFSEEMVKYARQDVRVQRKLWHHVRDKAARIADSLQLEHDVAWVIHLQERNGFTLNVKKAMLLEAELRQELYDIEQELQTIFPPIFVRSSTKGPFVPKRDNKKMGYTAGCPITKVEIQVFNPGSRQQIGERLIRKYGWKPRTFTSTGLPEINEGVVADLPYPEAKALLRYLTVAKQLGQLSDGDNGWLKLVRDTGRVHGRVNPNGTRTRRMTHFAPNLGQVNKKDLRMREVWEPRAGWKQVGIDGDGIQARGLAHYLAPYDGGTAIDRIVNGSKEAGTDTHSANLAVLKPLGLVTRDGAKTTLYALMFGAGDVKLGKTLQEDRRENGLAPVRTPLRKLGKEVRAALARSMVGIDKLDALLKQKSKSPGFLRALDGGRLPIQSAHTALSSLLQGFEAVVMKKALCIFHYELAPAAGFEHGRDFDYLVNVHDEVQIECRPEYAEQIGKLFAEAITTAGVRLGVRCPMVGTYAIGDNWKDTH